MEPGYIFLLQEREFVRLKEDVYKFGKTTLPNFEQFIQYPKGSILKLQIACSDCTSLEKQILARFRDSFGPSKDEYGDGYFEGSCEKMIEIICASVSKSDKTIDLPNSILAKFKEDSEKKRTAIIFDYKDNYSFAEFISELQSKQFKSELELYQFILVNGSRVFAKMDNGTFIIKNTNKQSFISRISLSNITNAKIIQNENTLNVRDAINDVSLIYKNICLFPANHEDIYTVYCYPGINAQNTSNKCDISYFLKFMETICGDNYKNVIKWLKTAASNTTDRAERILAFNKTSDISSVLVPYLMCMFGNVACEVDGLLNFIKKSGAHEYGMKLIVINDNGENISEYMHDKLKEIARDEFTKGFKNISNIIIITDNAAKLTKQNTKIVHIQGAICDFMFINDLRKEISNKNHANTFYTYLMGNESPQTFELKVPQKSEPRTICDKESKFFNIISSTYKYRIDFKYNLDARDIPPNEIETAVNTVNKWKADGDCVISPAAFYKKYTDYCTATKCEPIGSHGFRVMTKSRFESTIIRAYTYYNLSSRIDKYITGSKDIGNEKMKNTVDYVEEGTPDS